ncbi:unnamed protein product [Brassica oleracea var. botrytis]
MRKLSFHSPLFSSYINPFIEAHIQSYSTTSVQRYQSMAMKSVQNSGKSHRDLADNKAIVFWIRHLARAYLRNRECFEAVLRT